MQQNSMIIFNTTYTEKSDLQQINRLLGKSFSFYQKLRLGGIGSSRLIIKNVSHNFQGIINKVSDLNYANIELRPKGIIVHVTSQVKRYSWAIPYYKLIIFNATFFSVHSDGAFIQMKKSNVNKSFVKKMINLKTLSNEKLNFIDEN